ncbi:NACHT domain-containing protein [Xanthomonas arboricola]|uniref:NACHT domain-containing protein n=1 Tax=Xanthomonas arboricola TaxID=56448 RepID=UPI000C834B14|nr:NACHT domain-containing protein [Xanthomonas arboricola]SOU01050.1 hypothetical protein LMG19144_00065 [Xanthomonas arboricola pv. fragariae]
MEIPVINWLDEPAKKSVSSVFDGINSKVEALDVFNKYRSAHFSSLHETVGKVKVLGMSSPINLAELYYPTLVSSDIRRRLYQSEWHALQDKKTVTASGVHRFRPIDGADYVEKSNRLVVLGGPGAGKTTFLKFLALAYSQKQIFENTKLKTSKLPFFVSLPDLAKTNETVFAFVAALLKAREGEYFPAFIERSFKKGLAIILFDSLDEVPESGRSEVLKKIRDFCRTYPDNKVIVSCRAADYTEVLENFDEVELVKLSKAAVEKIVKSWFRQDTQLGKKLLEVINSDLSISDLTETPLLLSLLCIQFKHDLSLPRRKVEVYRRCVETLLREWDTTRGFRRLSSYESLSDMHKERLFEYIAGEGTAAGQTYNFADSKVYASTAEYIERLGIPSCEAKNVVAEVERHHGILERHSLESFCFSHASIQDYFAARYAISSRSELQIVRDRIEDESWSTVIEFICGLHPNPDDIFDLMIKRTALKDLKNYPAIERRAKILYLMYRCLSVGPTLRPQNAIAASQHIVQSLKLFVERMAESGVYPLCTMGPGGVRHPYFHTGAKRPSLHSALLPYRKLSNEILNRSVAGFSSAAFEDCNITLAKQELTLLDVTVILGTIVPLSKSAPQQAASTLDEVKKKLPKNLAFIGRLIDESVNEIRN